MLLEEDYILNFDFIVVSMFRRKLFFILTSESTVSSKSVNEGGKEKGKKGGHSVPNKWILWLVNKIAIPTSVYCLYYIMT